MICLTRKPSKQDEAIAKIVDLTGLSKEKISACVLPLPDATAKSTTIEQVKAVYQTAPSRSQAEAEAIKKMYDILTK